MYIMRKMNREKKAATEAEHAALLADGYRDVTSPAVQGMPAQKEDPVNTGKLPAEKSPDKAGSPVKKAKAVDTKQKKTAKVSGPDRQKTTEKENSSVPDPSETAGSVQEENAGAAAVPDTRAQLPVDIAGPAREQSAELTAPAQQSPEGMQTPD